MQHVNPASRLARVTFSLVVMLLCNASLASPTDDLPLDLFAQSVISANSVSFGGTGCQISAARLFSACKFDSAEERGIALAYCHNLYDPQARMQCRREARDVQIESIGECVDIYHARIDTCDVLNEDRYDPDPLTDKSIQFVDPRDIGSVHAPSPWLSLVEGRTTVLKSSDGEEVVVVMVTDEVREIEGVTCRVVVDLAFLIEEDEDGDLEYVAEEFTDDWYAQDDAGNVYYCGELSRNYEDGLLNNLDGSFEAGVESAKAGVLLRATPMPGEAHRTEFALDEAEDVVQYLDTAASVADDEGGDVAGFECNGGCLKTFDFAPIDPSATEYKYYLPGIGFVLAVALEDGKITGDREVLACVGDDISVIEEPACGIADPDELFEELCELAAEHFCD